MSCKSKQSKTSIVSYFQKANPSVTSENEHITINESDKPPDLDIKSKLDHIEVKKPIHPFFKSNKDNDGCNRSQPGVESKECNSTIVDLVSNDKNGNKAIQMIRCNLEPTNHNISKDITVVSDQSPNLLLPQNIPNEERKIERGRRKKIGVDAETSIDTAKLPSTAQQTGRQLRPRIIAQVVVEEDEFLSDSSLGSEPVAPKRRALGRPVAASSKKKNQHQQHLVSSCDDVEFVGGNRKASEFFLDKEARARKRADDVRTRFQEELTRSKEMEKAFFASRSGERTANPFFTTVAVLSADKAESSNSLCSGFTVAEEAPVFPAVQHVLQQFELSQRVLCSQSMPMPATRTVVIDLEREEESQWRGAVSSASPITADLIDNYSLGDVFPAAFVAWLTAQRRALDPVVHESTDVEETAQPTAFLELQCWIRGCLRIASEDPGRRRDDRSGAQRGSQKGSSHRRAFRHSDDDIDEFSSGEEVEEEQANVLVLRGCSGTGKTALVHASAESLGVRVIEIGTDSARGGATVKRLAAEATQSRGISVTATSQLPAQAGELCLILFDEADILFPEDSGFSSAILSLARTTRRPIVLTSESRLSFLSSLRPPHKEVLLMRPDTLRCARYLSAAFPGLEANDYELLSVVCQCDTRRARVMLELLPRSESAAADSAEQEPFVVWLRRRFHYDFAVLDSLGRDTRLSPTAEPPGLPLKLRCDLILPEVESAAAVPREDGGWDVTVRGRHFLQRSLPSCADDNAAACVEVLLGGEAMRHWWPMSYKAQVVSDAVLRFSLPPLGETGNPSTSGVPLAVTLGKASSSSRAENAYCWLRLQAQGAPRDSAKRILRSGASGSVGGEGRKATKVNPSVVQPDSDDDFEPDKDEGEWRAKRQRELKESLPADRPGRRKSRAVVVEDEDVAEEVVETVEGGAVAMAVNSELVSDNDSRGYLDSLVVALSTAEGSAPPAAPHLDLDSVSAIEVAEAGRSGQMLPRAFPEQAMADGTTLDAFSQILGLLSDAALLDAIALSLTSDSRYAPGLVCDILSEGGLDDDGSTDLKGSELTDVRQPWWVVHMPATAFLRHYCAETVSSVSGPAILVPEVPPSRDGTAEVHPLEPDLAEQDGDGEDEAEFFGQQSEVSVGLIGSPSRSQATPRDASVNLCVSRMTRDHLGGFLVSLLQSAAWTESAGTVLRAGFQELHSSLPSPSLSSHRLDLMPYLAAVVIAEDAMSSRSGASLLGRGHRRSAGRFGRPTVNGPLQRLELSSEDRSAILRLGTVCRL